MWRTVLVLALVGCAGAHKPAGGEDSAAGGEGGEGGGGGEGGDTDEELSVTVTAASSTARPLEQVQLTATVTGASSQEVSWSVSSGPGDVDDEGLFTADEDVGVAVIEACTEARGGACGSAEITVARGGTLNKEKTFSHSDQDYIFGYTVTDEGLFAVGETYEDNTSARNFRVWTVALTWAAGIDNDLGGKQWFDFNNAGCAARDASLDEDGRPVVVGDFRSDDTSFLMRLDDSGDLDDRFGDEGKIEVEGVEYRKVLVDADGGYLVVTGASILRYTTDGELDTAYGDEGLVPLVLPRADASYGDVSVLDLRRDGETTVLLGYARDGLVYGRFDLDGQPNAAVSSTGLTVPVEFGGTDVEGLRSFDLDDQGRMLVAWDEPESAALMLAAILPEGTLDEDFGDDGVASVVFDDPDTINDYEFDACCTAVDEEGRVVVAGVDSPTLLVTRFLPDGNLDPAWGDDQYLYAAAQGEIEAIAAEITPEGLVAVLGIRDDGEDGDDDDLVMYLFDP